MQDREEEFAAELKARIKETEDPAKKRELEARLARMENDVKGVGGVKARHARTFQTTAYVPGGGAFPKEPKPNDGSPAFMNNDPKSNPDMEDGRDYDLGEPRVNDGMHDTEQVNQGKSVSGPIDPDRRRDDVRLAHEADIDYNDQGNPTDKNVRKESERAEAERFEKDKPAEDTGGEASKETAKQAESKSGKVDEAKKKATEKDAKNTPATSSPKHEAETEPRNSAATKPEAKSGPDANTGSKAEVKHVIVDKDKK